MTATATVMGAVGPEICERVPPNTDAKKPTAIAPYRPAAAPIPEAMPKASAIGSATTMDVRAPKRSPRKVSKPYFNGSRSLGLRYAAERREAALRGCAHGRIASRSRLSHGPFRLRGRPPWIMLQPVSPQIPEVFQRVPPARKRGADIKPDHRESGQHCPRRGQSRLGFVKK